MKQNDQTGSGAPRMKRLFPNGRVLVWELSGYGWVLVGRNWP